MPREQPEGSLRRIRTAQEGTPEAKPWGVNCEETGWRSTAGAVLFIRAPQGLCQADMAGTRQMAHVLSSQGGRRTGQFGSCWWHCTMLHSTPMAAVRGEHYCFYLGDPDRDTTPCYAAQHTAMPSPLLPTWESLRAG